MNLRSVALALLPLGTGALCVPGAARAQQAAADQLIAAARQQLEAINPESASVLLRRALDPASGATIGEKIRGLVLFGATELTAGRVDGARRAFREALALDRAQKVDSLAELHEALVVTFEQERAFLIATAGPAPGVLEIRGLPEGSRLVVDSVVWTTRRRDVPPGLHRLEATARGYLPLRDSVLVGPGVTVIRDVAMVRADLARLSVAAEPWGVVYLDNDRLGETPLFEWPVPAGSYALRIESPARAEPVRRQLDLPAGRVTRLWTMREAATPRPSPAPLARADSLFSAAEYDSALAVYRAVARDTATALAPAIRANAGTRAAMIHYAASRSRRDSARLDSARVYFGAAYRLAPSYEPDTADMGPELRAAMVAARARVLALVVEVPLDTLLSPLGGRLRIVARPTHAAEIQLRIVPAEGAGPAVRADSQRATQSAAFDWNLRLADGSLVRPGSYRLIVSARDSAGVTAPLVERALAIVREVVDTMPEPPPLPASAFASETVRVAHASPRVLFFGLALTAATLSMEKALRNPELGSGLGTGSGAYAVGGAISLAAVVGFLGGHHIGASPENIRHNQELRDQHARRRAEIAAANARARENARFRLRFAGSP